MKKSFLSLILLFTLVYTVNAQDDSIPQTKEQQETAKKVATEWVSMFYKTKDIDSIMKISKTPFALDNKKILNSNKELEELYTSILEQKVSQKFPKIDTEIYGYKYEIIDEFIPINVLHIKAGVTEDGKERIEHIVISIEISGDNYKVIGFRD